MCGYDGGVCGLGLLGGIGNKGIHAMLPKRYTPQPN
jgi:hypothetical protein